MNQRDVTEYKRTQEQVNQEARDLVQIYRVSQTLASTLELGEVTRRLMQAVVQVTRAEGGSIWLWDKDHANELVCQGAFHPAVDKVLIGQRLPKGQGLVG
jgi:GAF domain-containing protein